jgi:predicted component of type VI protein secretion system
MNVFVNGILQVLGFIILTGNQLTQYVPEKYKGIVTGIVSLAMGAVAIFAHFRNPDGTNAKAAYTVDGN